MGSLAVPHTLGQQGLSPHQLIIAAPLHLTLFPFVFSHPSLTLPSSNQVASWFLPV